MKVLFIAAIFLLMSIGILFPEMMLKDYMDTAGELNNQGKTEEAITLMREAAEKYPDNPDVLALLGFYVGKSAGETDNFQLQASRAFESFNILDKAVRLDFENLNALFYRGLMSVKVPPFLGKLNQGIEDLETLLSLLASAPEHEVQRYAVQTRMFLAEGYEKKEDILSALKMWEEIFELNSDPEITQKASQEIERLKEIVIPFLESESISPSDLEEVLTQAQLLYESEEYFKAETLLLKAVETDENCVDAHSLLAYVYLALSEAGYAEIISENTDYRTNLCFKAMDQLDRVLELEPENTEFRLLRGIMGVQFPFFVGRLEQGISDLNIFMQSSAPDSMKAEALFNLGYGYRKLGTSKWISVVNDYPSSEQAESVFESFNPRPTVSDITSLETPCLTIEFALGFQDELPPQTAVWIEDEKGNFVKTIYVSGFAGHVKSVQVTLPLWGNTSNFETDATTGASIDLGNHFYTWDLDDGFGDMVPNGIYVVNVEVSYWPSYKYETVSLPILLADGNKYAVKNDALLVPYLELNYIYQAVK